MTSHIMVSAQNFRRIEKQSGISEIADINGVAVADIDGDYDLDILAVIRQKNQSNDAGQKSRLFRNNNDGTYTDITTDAGIVSSFDYSDTYIDANLGMKMGASWGDFNNDGYPDLILTSVHHIELYQNVDGTRFTNITTSANLPAENTCLNTGATWWDYDNDGFLDIYITKWGGCPSNMLFHNSGNGRFEEVTTALGLQDSLNYQSGEFDASWMSVPIDVNDDGLQDLLVSSDFGVENRLYINQGQSGFKEEAVAYGIDDLGRNAMGITIGDPNGDGAFDFYVTNIATSSLFLKTTNDKFSNSSNAWQVAPSGWAWATQFADMDHDLDEDLLIVNGYGSKSTDFYYENRLSQGNQIFVDQSSTFGFFQNTDANGMAVFDYDNDGDLDVLTANSDDPMHFYENELITATTPPTKNWLEIWLVGTVSNKSAIGATVELLTTNGNLIRHHSGASFMAQHSAPVHFGISTAQEILSIKVKWPLGHEDIYENIEPNQIIKITEKGALEKLENLKAVKIAGCVDPLSCNYNPDATVDDGTCQYLATGTISGDTKSANLKLNAYTYQAPENYTYEWSVEGGHIVSGHSSGTVEIRWGLEASGTVKLSITDGNCYSQTMELKVQLSTNESDSEHSVARIWNEVLLEAIRNDYARPTIHARNLYHASIAMYDAWAVYHSEQAQPYLLNQTLHGFTNNFDGFETNEEIDIALEKTISYAMYRLIAYRYRNSPKYDETESIINQIMDMLGYDPNITSVNLKSGDPIALGNYIANAIIQYGLQDGSREERGYDNAYYSPTNKPLQPDFSGNATISDPNRWQPLSLSQFIDQAGNPINTNTPEFLSPEWGSVDGFALSNNNVKTYVRDENNYQVHFDPGPPPMLDTINNTDDSELYKWNFSLVSIWSSHLDPNDGVIWDISPKSLGNIDINKLPSLLINHPTFYDNDGGDLSEGHSINPVTGMPYKEQRVPRGDYTRVLAEFWADGPDSETPPGHWFTLLNYVSDHPLFEKRFEGQGELLNDLEWDVKAYFLLGGAMHDAAIAAWSIKGWYDYIRPISAIRYMADRGQSTDPNLPNYDIGGIPLVDGLIELVTENDELSGGNNEHLGKVKLYAWRGHHEVYDFETDVAGVGWILAEDWWPYQRPSFVTPPFAGYVSGHSTFSRAAAEVLTMITGSPYFPGGLGEFVAEKNEFLVFEEGPSQDVVLQWATYRDASDQCSLSRIWGGIHPPADDIPGRIIGEKIGQQAFEFGKQYFKPTPLQSKLPSESNIVYPNPVNSGGMIHFTKVIKGQVLLIDLSGKVIILAPLSDNLIQLPKLPKGLYVLKTDGMESKVFVK
ncbi:MAG: VCBS repeat-containing protein [Cyclobacteriaceae bacterium]